MSGNTVTWNLYANDYGPDARVRYLHVGTRRYVELHQTGDRISPVIVTEDEAGIYYGWVETGSNCPTMIWPSRGQLDMCFPKGADPEVERGKGRVVRLRIEPREEKP